MWKPSDKPGCGVDFLLSWDLGEVEVVAGNRIRSLVWVAMLVVLVGMPFEVS